MSLYRLSGCLAESQGNNPLPGYMNNPADISLESPRQANSKTVVLCLKTGH